VDKLKRLLKIILFIAAGLLLIFIGFVFFIMFMEEFSYFFHWLKI